jgi:hypothetical protein
MTRASNLMVAAESFGPLFMSHSRVFAKTWRRRG